MTTDNDWKIPVFGGGHFYVAHGTGIVLLADSGINRWRNAAPMFSDQARRLAARLLQQADEADNLKAGGAKTGRCQQCGRPWSQGHQWPPDWTEPEDGEEAS